MKLLIAEDDNNTRLLLYFALKKFGYEVVQAKNGEDAWEQLQQDDPPKILILDWMMPKMDGIEVCKNVRKQTGGQPPYIIILTSKNAPEDIIEALHAGADEFLTKPINQTELRARVEVGKRIITLQESLQEHIEHLQEALDEVKTLQGFISICAYCHKVRTDTSWEKLENYITQHANVTFSHGICPECIVNVVKPEMETLKKIKLQEK